MNIDKKNIYKFIKNTLSEYIDKLPRNILFQVSS